jgi:hypothetical protein
MATLHELDTVYSVEDVYLMLEVLTTDAHNARLATKKHAFNS